MPELVLPESRIVYEVAGDGYPVLLFAPGFLFSRMERWRTNPAKPGVPQDFLNPMDHLADRFKLVAVDMRNAGASRGKVGPDASWNIYVEDTLALMDHLGIREAHVMGACIGVSFAYAIAKARPGLARTLVLQNPIGLFENRDLIESEYNQWADVAADYPEVDAGQLSGFYERLFGNDFLFAISRDFVKSCAMPTLLMPGSDRMHPVPISEEIAALAPNVEVFSPWKGDGHKRAAMERIRSFLIENTPSA